jgi:hypothetical protein
MKRLILFLAIPLLFAACQIFDKDYVSYYDVIGEGYAYYEDTGAPVQSGSRASVSTNFPSHQLGTSDPIKEYFPIDNGHYRVRFINEVWQDRAVSYSIDVALDSTIAKSYNCNGVSFSIEKVKNANKILKLDTVKILINH